MSRYNLITDKRSIVELQTATFTITDYKIAGYGSDDKIYSQNRDVWEMLPRGLAVVKADNDIVCELYGLQKFGEESDNYGLTLNSGEYKAKEYYLEKENGECFHITAFEYNSGIYWVGGSKNVHGIVRDCAFLEDLENPEYNKPRYTFFKKMMSKFNIHRNIIVYVVNHKVTLIAESIDLSNQHLVQYGCDELRFVAIRKNTKSLDTLCYHPDVSRAVFRDYGLRTVNMREVRMDDANREDVRAEFQNKENSEGAVVYVVTNMGRIVCMYKLKNYTYVFVRAIRERMRSFSNSTAIKDRINDLHIDHPLKDQLLEEYLQFNAWCRLLNSKGELEWDKLFSQWVSYYVQFKDVDKDTRKDILEQFDNNMSNQIQIFMLGPPGSGKSTLAEILAQLLDGTRYNQDAFRGSAKKYHTALKTTTSNIVLLDKCNHTYKVRQAARDYLSQGKVYYVLFPNTPIEELEKRINMRGKAHDTLFPGKKVNSILHMFKNTFEPLTDSEVTNSQAVIELEDDISNNIVKVLDVLGIEKDHAIIDNCIYNVLTNEETLNEKNTKYWGLEIQQDMKYIIAEIQPPEEFLVKDDFHVTIVFIDKFIDQTNILNWCRDNEGMVFEIKVVNWSMDDHNIAVKVYIDTPCQNTIPHITIAHTKQSTADHSNQMLAEQSPQEFSIGYHLTGILRRW